MIIYTENITSRFSYIVQTILGNHITITHLKEVYINSSLQKINYSNTKINQEELWIKPHSLLLEKNIQEQHIEVFKWNNLPVFFKTEGDIPFDFFAAAFYLISRYEEYLPHKKDMYGRYAHENSIAYQHQFLQQPLINLWLQELVKQFSLKLQQQTVFSYVPSYDIDIAYSYQHHSLYKNLGGFAKDFFKANLTSLKERLSVCFGNKKDPFDVYEFLDKLHQQYQLQPIYFFLLAAKRKGYDKNILPQHNAMKALIKKHATNKIYQVGIHPSWQSANNENILANEINTLSTITNKPVNASRQHYINFHLPTTYRLLIKNNIQHDYSMGYGSINGFRASYTLPFQWYDLLNETITSLTIHPFCFMEANAIFEQKISPTQAAEELQNYFDIVQKVQGQLITIFHNHFITTQPQWLAWRKLYLSFLSKNFNSTKE
jgi:hypothetical protein